MYVMIEDGNITSYKVNVEITSILENAHDGASAQESGAGETSGFDSSSSHPVGGSIDAADEMVREEYQ
jgi:hypothetical protein